MHYLMVGLWNVAFCENAVELRNALAYRQKPECMVYGSDDWAELQQQALIGQRRLFDNYTDTANPIEPMQLPSVITEPVYLEYEASMRALTFSIASGSWAISGINGFCTADSDEDLCALLAGETIVYPISMWCPNHAAAIIAARNNYTRRFYLRYDARVEHTNIPQKPLEFFQDAYYETREKRRKAMIDAWQKRVMMLLEYGWV